MTRISRMGDGARGPRGGWVADEILPRIARIFRITRMGENRGSCLGPKPSAGEMWTGLF